MMKGYSDRYFQLLELAVFGSDPETALTASAELGRHFLRCEVPPEVVTEIHHRAVLRIAVEHPCLSLAQVAERLSPPLMEMMMAYSLAFREQQEQKYTSMVNQRLAQSNQLEALGTLAAGIAHDFNTLLGVIHGYAELAGDRFPDQSAGWRDVRQIIAASGRARDLVARMLAFARQQPIAPAEVDAVALIDSALQMFRVGVASGVVLSFRSELSHAMMLADPIQIEQIVMNLCLNGADAMGGRGRLELALRAVPEPPHRCRLVISDAGCGMPPEVLERVFDPFYTTKEPGRGSGLGLSVVYGIVSALQGEIRIRSQVNVGSEVDVLLPLIVDAAAHAARNEEMEARG